MKISEIVKTEEGNKVIVLHKEGLYWPAYEHSAFLFMNNIKEYTWIINKNWQIAFKKQTLYLLQKILDEMKFVNYFKSAHFLMHLLRCNLDSYRYEIDHYICKFWRLTATSHETHELIRLGIIKHYK